MSDRRVRLVCTVGPATAAPERIRELAEAGTDVFRINFSHGSREDHAAAVTRIRDVAEAVGRDLGVLADLPGPKIRLRELASDPLRLDTGQRFVLRSGDGVGDRSGASVSHDRIVSDLRPGDRVFLSDGVVELVVREAAGSDVVTECVHGGAVRSRAGVNVPAHRLSLASITAADRDGVTAALEFGADFVAQSFVRRASDVHELRSLFQDSSVPIVAKIETRPALEELEGILEAADAIMLARGDLGVELPMAEVPIVQKRVVRTARAIGKPVIVATQMLESMVRSPRPTRAEASDVANAVLEGADAVMLSAETAVGEFPVEAARAAATIAQVAEREGRPFRVPQPPCRHVEGASAIAHTAAELADHDRSVRAIACFTRTGRTAALVSNERPRVPIYAFSSDVTLRRRQTLRWGVTPLSAPKPRDTDELIAVVERGLVTAGVVQRGDVIVVAASAAGKETDLVKLHRVGGDL